MYNVCIISLYDSTYIIIHLKKYLLLLCTCLQLHILLCSHLTDLSVLLVIRMVEAGVNALHHRQEHLPQERHNLTLVLGN